jgi:hydroxyacylglutathione hydrolase
MQTAGSQAGRADAAGPRVAVETFTLGPFETNCYVVYETPGAPAPAGRPCWVVDASFEPDALIARVRELRLEPQKLILTHAHVDHIAGVEEVLRAFPDAELSIHSAEAGWLSDPAKNLSAMMGLPVTTRPAARVLEEGDELRLGESVWRVLHTPGHSPGGVTLHLASGRLALAGDSLFAGSIGRTDFPGSDPATLARSIRERLYTMDPETAVYPGHGPATTIGREKNSNPFVRG